MSDGLLGKIGGGIGKVLNNPHLQGLLGAAAFGANPLIGLLAGQGIKGGRDKRELENEVMRRDLTSRRELRDLLGRRVPTDRLLDVEGGPATALTELAPSAAVNPVTGAPGVTPNGSVAAIDMPGGQQELMGLLGELAPGVVAQGMMGQQAQPSAFDEKINFIGQLLGPDSPEFKEASLRIAGGAEPGTTLDELIAGFQLRMLERDLADAEGEAATKALELQVERKTLESGVHKSLNQIREMIALNEQLSQSGLLTRQGPLADSRAAGAAALGMVGFEEQGEDAAAAARFDGLTKNLAIMGIQTGSFNGNTDTKFNAYRDTKPSSRQGSKANALTLADTLEGVLALADANEVPLETLQSWEELLEQTRLKYNLTGDASNSSSDSSAQPPAGSVRIP